MSLMESIKQKAKAEKKRILLPEGPEERTVQAVGILMAEGIADVTLLGSAEEIRAAAAKFGVSLAGVEIVDPLTDKDRETYVAAYYELRKEKGVTPEKAESTMRDPLFYAAMMVKNGRGDGMVAGALCTTGETLRPGLQIIKMAKGISVVSSCFIMEVPNKAYGDDGLMLFGDCAVNPCPTAEQLAAIAISSAVTAKSLCGMEPRVAMLSFSTKGSAKHELVDKVVEATRIAHELAPELNVDGELQADAALVEKVGKLKSPGSTVAGKANVLIFPDLNSGNIAYKLTQYMAGAKAIGPFLQGFAKPISDLSRGASVEDIVATTAVCLAQA